MSHPVKTNTLSYYDTVGTPSFPEVMTGCMFPTAVQQQYRHLPLVAELGTNYLSHPEANQCPLIKKMRQQFAIVRLGHISG